MPSLSKEQIRSSAKKLITKTVPTPEWGEGSYVTVRRLGADDRVQFELANVKGRGKEARLDLSNVSARLVALCLVNEQGDRLFTDEEVKELGQYDGLVMDRIFEACKEINGLFAAGMEQAEKNSETAPS